MAARQVFVVPEQGISPGSRPQAGEEQVFRQHILSLQSRKWSHVVGWKVQQRRLQSWVSFLSGKIFFGSMNCGGTRDLRITQTKRILRISPDKLFFFQPFKENFLDSGKIIARSRFGAGVFRIRDAAVILS
jgi:hypothetical protein